MNWRWIAETAPKVLLPTLFIGVSARLAWNAWTQSWLGVDAQIYYRGSAAWLAGESPWSAVVYSLGQPAHYSALPTTVVLLAPATSLPEPAFVPLFLVASAIAAWYVIRKLGLPWYYLAFPPLFQGVQTGNPNVVLLALLLTGVPFLEALAPILKVYAAIPIVGRLRLRSAAWAAAFVVLTLPAMLLWVEYFATFMARSGRLLEEASGGWSAPLAGPVETVVTAIAVGLLWARDREAGSWLAVPALWPASQLHYAALAMPLLKDRWWLAAFLAVPIPGLPALAPFLVLGEMAVRSRRAATGARRVEDLHDATRPTGSDA